MKIIELTENKFRKPDLSKQEITKFVNDIKALKLKPFTQVGLSPKEKEIAKYNLQSSPGQEDLIFFNDFPTDLFIKQFITYKDNILGKELNHRNGAQNLLKAISKGMPKGDPFVERFTLQDAQKIKALWDQMSERTKDKYSWDNQSGIGPGF